MIYSAADFALSIGSGFVKVPLKMGLANCLNKKKSIFDVMVRKFDNNQFILGEKASYGGAMLLYFLSVGAKGNSLYNEAVDASK